MKKTLQTQFNTRQYMLSRDFEVYYYNDCNLSGVGAHTHDYYEFYFFIGGQVTMEISGKEYRLSSGDLVLIPPGIRHRAIITSDGEAYQRFIFWISREYLKHLMDESADYGYLIQHASVAHKYVYHLTPSDAHAIHSSLFMLIEELHSDRFGKTAKVSLLVNDLIISLNRIVYTMETPHIPPAEITLYQSLLHYIETHLDEPLTLESLAGEFFVSKYYISHLFKENFGLSVHQYILKKRLANSCAAILSGVSISEACTSCGFADYSVFYRAFRKEYGISPKEFQEQHHIQA